MTDQLPEGPTTPGTGESAASPAPAALPVKSSRGKAAKPNRHGVILSGLGVPVPEQLDLGLRDDRLALIGAIVAAVAGGKCSGLTAQTLLAAVRESRAESGEKWEELAHRQAEIIDQMRSGRTIDAT